MSEHLGDEPAPDWLRERFPGWTFRRGISGRWFAWNPGKPDSEAPDFMGDDPHDLDYQIIRAAWQKAGAEARSGT